MNSTKQCVNSESICEVTVHARKKKKKKAENVDVRKRGMQTVTIYRGFQLFQLVKFLMIV